MSGYLIFTITDYGEFSSEGLLSEYLYDGLKAFYKVLIDNKICFEYRLYFDINPFDYDSSDNYIYTVEVDDYGV